MGGEQLLEKVAIVHGCCICLCCTVFVFFFECGSTEQIDLYCETSCAQGPHHRLVVRASRRSRSRATHFSCERDARRNVYVSRALRERRRSIGMCLRPVTTDGGHLGCHHAALFLWESLWIYACGDDGQAGRPHALAK